MVRARNNDQKLAIERRAGAATTKILDAPGRQLEAITAQALLESLNAQGVESTHIGATEASLAAAIAATDLVAPVLAQLHSLVPELANEHKVPTTVSARFKSDDIAVGTDFDSAVKAGLGSVEFVATGASGEVAIPPSDFVKSVFGPVLELANKLISTRAGLEHDREIGRAHV